MKKILFAAVAAMAITGCSQNEEIEKAVQPVEISFNTAVSKTTRATTLVNSAFTKFTAYAYSTTGAFADATEVNALISGTEFELKESTWGSGSSVFYWPATDQVSFFAFSPNTTEQFSWGAAAAKTAPTLTYTVKDAVKDQEDLVVAEAMNKQKATSGSTEAVALNFKHALTQVGFKIKGEGSGVTYTLNKIVINAKKKGVYTYGATSTTSETTLGTWTIPSDVTANTAYTVEPTKALSITGADNGGTANETLVGADYTAMLIPQDLTGVTFEIYYKAEAGGAILCDKTTTPEEITFADGTWTAGQSVAYVLTLKGVEKMSITGSVADSWDFTDTPK